MSSLHKDEPIKPLSRVRVVRGYERLREQFAIRQKLAFDLREVYSPGIRLHRPYDRYDSLHVGNRFKPPQMQPVVCLARALEYAVTQKNKEKLPPIAICIPLYPSVHL